jgi:predicted dehydrogenase
MAEMTWNVNQPGRWRRPDLTATIKKEEVDWDRFLINRPYHEWDPRIYLEYRLFWPFSSGIPGQWMAHQIDTVHWFTGYNHPRTVVANGGIYLWKDGRTNYDTMTAVMEYGPENDPTKGFQVLYSSRFTNSAGGIKEIYYSNAGEINLDTNKVTPNGGLRKREADEMGMKENLLEEFTLKSTEQVVASANTGGDPMSSGHMRNWMECIRSRRQTNAPVDAGYNHSVACIMVNAAIRTKETVTFDPVKQEVMAGGKVFKY